MGLTNGESANIFRFLLLYNRSVNKARFCVSYRSLNKSEPEFTLSAHSLQIKINQHNGETQKPAEGTYLRFSFRDIVNTRCSQEKVTLFPGLLAIIFQPKDSFNFWYSYRTSTKAFLKDDKLERHIILGFSEQSCVYSCELHDTVIKPKWLCIKTMLLITPQLELSILNILWIYFRTARAVPVKYTVLKKQMKCQLSCICKQHSYTKFNKSVRTNISIELYIFPN